MKTEITNPLEGVDIEAEYRLIQEKKSNLSRAKRDLVCKIYPEFVRLKENREKNKKKIVLPDEVA